MSEATAVNSNVKQRGSGLARFVIAAVVVVVAGGYFMYRPGPTIGFAAEGAAWSKGWNDSVRRSRDSGKPALVLFTADWCPACRWFESNALTQVDVRSYMQSNYTPIMVDLTQSDSPNQALARQYKIDVIPTLVAFDGNGGEVARSHAMPGNELLAWLRTNYRARK
jgi:thiol:disulfide interchange protein